MGNRESFPSPGIQWISAGSGIEHAEGGGNAAGAVQTGFQIWVNVPSARKMDAPRYGTEPPSALPIVPLGAGASARVIAGTLNGVQGPFKTIAAVQMLDVMLDSNASATFDLDAAHDNALAYTFEGSGTVCGATVPSGSVVRLAAGAEGGGASAARTVSIVAGASSMRVIFFAGKQLKQPIAWHGPFVMTSDEEIRETLSEYRRGTFLKHRAPWDYKSAAAGRKYREKGGGGGEL